MDYGIQLFSVRDLSEKSLADAVAGVANLGYSSVEFAGFFGHTAQQVKEMLDKNNIKISGTHSPLCDLENAFEETVAFHKAIGNKNYIIPGHDLSSQEKLDDFIAKVNPIAEKLAAEGITLAYHNHSHEFGINADGSNIYDQLIYRTDLKLEIDTYWAFVGMKNPLLLLERLKDRVIFVHMKDGLPDGSGKPLGMGEAPVLDIYNKVKEMGIPMVVESETCTPDGMTEAEICIKYLRSIEK